MIGGSFLNVYIDCHVEWRIMGYVCHAARLLYVMEGWAGIGAPTRETHNSTHSHLIWLPTPHDTANNAEQRSAV